MNPVFTPKYRSLYLWKPLNELGLRGACLAQEVANTIKGLGQALFADESAKGDLIWEAANAASLEDGWYLVFLIDSRVAYVCVAGGVVCLVNIFPADGDVLCGRGNRILVAGK